MRFKVKEKKLTVALIYGVVLSGILVGCMPSSTSNSVSSILTSISEASQINISKISVDLFTDRDMEVGYDESSSVKVTLSDSGATATDSSVKILQNTVTIAGEGTFILTGKMTGGQIIVEAQNTDKIQIVLDNVEISNNSSAAIYVKQADKVFITLANNSKNVLSVTGEFVAIDDNNIDAVIFSKDDLTLNGNGTLMLNTEHGNGITSKDDLVLTSGTYEIDASGHGIEGKDSVSISNGTYKIMSGKDGIHSENSDDASLGVVYIANGDFNITAQADGIDGQSLVQIEDGNFSIITSGGSENASTKSDGNVQPNWGNRGGTDQKQRDGQTASVAVTDTAAVTASAKGIKATGSVIIGGGSYDINSSDDSIHANSDVEIADGELNLSSGDDGIHADSNVTISSGSIGILKSYEGIEGQSIDIAGGIIKLVASDDGLNAAGGNDSSALGGRPGQGGFASDEAAYIKISGGIININANGDGIDSNGIITVSGGETYVSGSTNNGNGALDYDGSADVTGGIFVATGGVGMAQNFGSTSTQGSMLVNLPSVVTSKVKLTDKDGNVLAEHTPENQYQSVLISVPGIEKGGVYTLTTDTNVQEITMTELVFGSGSGMGGDMGGFKGERPAR